MRILSFSLKIAVLALIPFLAMTSCKDQTVVPDTAKISGTVTITNTDLWSTWKDSGVVELVLFGKYSLDPFPGSGWGDVPADYYGPGSPDGRYALGAPYNSQNPIVVNYSPGISGFTYEMDVDPGTYSALALGFRHNRITDPTLKTATLGVYWDHPNEVSHGIIIKPYFNDPAPTTFTVAKGDKVTIDFKADFSFVTQWYH
jgi:hypothetical protein